MIGHNDMVMKEYWWIFMIQFMPPLLYHVSRWIPFHRSILINLTKQA